ncbi:MAG: 5,10-methenyltetrahydrofolate synthetase [Gammaproteobacteria bacterium]|nr:5,10-methenyltetrahydrofolate synthetase [Gammaproteobacteria bacterium]
MLNRQLLRSALRQQRANLPFSIQGSAARAIASFIEGKQWFKRSSHLAFYAAVRGEIDPFLLLARAWELDKTCYLPAQLPPENGHQLHFIPYFPSDPLIMNDYGILEPDLSIRSPCKSNLLDCVFVPLVAFDSMGNRLGSGKGYYDKTFAYLLDFPAQRSTQLVGLSYDFQQVSMLNAESWDVPLDRVVVFDTLNNAVDEIVFANDK